MNRIRIQVGTDKPVFVACTSLAEATRRARRLVELFRLAGSGRPLLPVRGCARDGRWIVEGLHDPITVSVEKARRHA